MGMLIEEKCYLYGSCKCQTAGCVVLPDEGCPVYRYFKDFIVKDYENRLKADKVAMLDRIRAVIKAKIEEEEFARFVFRHEEKDTAKAEQCTGSIMAYKNMIKLIDKYKAESEKEK